MVPQPAKSIQSNAGPAGSLGEVISAHSMHWAFGYKSLMLALTAFPMAGLLIITANLALNRSDPEPDHYAAGVELRQQGYLEAAIAEFDEAISVDSESFKAFASRGDAYYALGKFSHALRDYSETIALKGTLVDGSRSAGDSSLKEALAGAHAGRALVHTELGDDLKAQREMANAVELGYDPQLAEAAIENVKNRR